MPGSPAKAAPAPGGATEIERFRTTNGSGFKDFAGATKRSFRRGGGGGRLEKNRRGA